MQKTTQHQGGVAWHQRASIWLGIGINPASISVGGGLATQLPLSDVMWVLPLGVLILTLLCISQGLIGRRYGYQLSQIATMTFGDWGSGLLSLMMAIGMVGWGGFQGGVSGASAADLLNWPGWAGALLVIGGLLILSEFGVNRWAALAWVTTGSAIGLTLFALGTVDLSSITYGHPGEILPPTTSTWVWAVTTLIAYSALFSLRNPDFSRDLRSDADVIKVNLCLFFPLLFSTSAGALLYYATGSWNIADILTQAQSASLGHIFLIIAVASPLLSGWYSGALALASFSPLNQRQSTILICALGFILAATRFDQLLLPFLGILGASLGPALLIILLSQRLTPRPSPRHAFAAWLISASVAIFCQWQGQSTYVFIGAVTSIFVLLAFYHWNKKTSSS